MNVNAYFPRDPILKKHIAYYYFLKTDSDDFNVSYYSFPNITTPLNIHRNITTEITGYSTKIAGCENDNTVMLIQGMRKYPLFVDLKGKLDKLTIHFKPLGVNHFIKRPFADVAQQDSQLFTEWNSGPDFQGFADDFYSTDDLNSRIELLEQFLMSVYNPRQIEPVFETALNRLTDFDNELSIDQIANQLDINPRTLNRFFNKHIGTSPVAFKKIARFRHSLHNKLTNEERKTLTEICYESNFYDQAYFINVYKQIAGSNPAAFFKSISKLADDQLVFRFLDKVALS